MNIIVAKHLENLVSFIKNKNFNDKKKPMLFEILYTFWFLAIFLHCCYIDFKISGGKMMNAKEIVDYFNEISIAIISDYFYIVIIPMLVKVFYEFLMRLFYTFLLKRFLADGIGITKEEKNELKLVFKTFSKVIIISTIIVSISVLRDVVCTSQL